MVDPNKVLTYSNVGPHSTNIPPIQHSIQHKRTEARTDQGRTVKLKKIETSKIEFQGGGAWGRGRWQNPKKARK